MTLGATPMTAPLAHVQGILNRVLLGQGVVVERLLITLIAGGHALLLGVPGLGKTRLALATAKAFDLSARRIQGTPDLMPADILGCEVLEENDHGKRSFRFVPGPIFAQCVIMDEINRAPPRTQAALLQAMEEGFVTVGGHDYPLPHPFCVLATQNPLEHLGTYPLPEAQRDRFLMCIAFDYPDAESEVRMLQENLSDSHPSQRGGLGGGSTESHNMPPPDPPLFQGGELDAAQNLACRIPVGESVLKALSAFIRSLRPGIDAPSFVQEGLIWGPSPRAAKGLLAAIRARAVLEGRSTPSVEDIAALAVPVLAHRVGARAGINPADIIEVACKKL